MNNLVIGSSGFIGKPLCQYLRHLNENVVELDIKNNPVQDARYLKLPLDDINRVYFLAWDVGGAKYLYDENNQLKQLEWNVALMTNIFPQLEKTKTKFMFVSSQLSYNTDSIYGITKKLGERWTELIGGTIVRLWNIYGPYEDASIRSHVVGDFIHQALSTGNIQMMTNGKEKRQFIHIDDLTYIMWQLMNTIDNGIYDITNNKWISIFKVAQIISKITGCTITKDKNKGSETKINPIPLKTNWNWKPGIQIHEGLEKTINKYKQNKRGI